MALSADTVWELRTTGSDTNGGGFVTGASGTDWSQQAAAQYAVTDGVTAGTTTITSATANFGTDVVGNLVYVQGGTGSVAAGWYQIVSRTNSTTIVVDRSTGLTAGTGVTLNIGGAMLTLNAINAVKVDGNICHAAAGTYSSATRQDWTTTLSTWNGSKPTLLIGYNTTRGDNPTGISQQPVFAGTGAGVDVFGISGSGIMAQFICIDGTDTARDGATGAPGTGNSGRGCGLVYVNVKRCSRYGVNMATSLLFVRVTDMKSGATEGFTCFGNTMNYCVSDNNPCNGFGEAGENSGATCFNCISAHNTQNGFASNNDLGSSVYVRCVAYRNSTSGFNCADGTYNAIVQLINCVAVANGGYGIKGNTRVQTPSVNYNAYGYPNTSGNLLGYAAGANDVTLTGDPFPDAATAATVAACDSIEDVFDLFRPDNTAGAGAALRGVGSPSYIDIGAIQHQDASGSSGPTATLRLTTNIGTY